MARDIYKNPNQKAINQNQGPRTGNSGTASKRSAHLEDKAGSKSTDLAKFVLDALEGRNPADFVDPKVEPLSANRGPKANPTAGGTKYNVYTKAPGPRPGKSSAKIKK